MKSVEDIGSWIMSFFEGDPDRALGEVEKSEDISDVDYIEEIPVFGRGNWGGYQSYLFSDEMSRHKQKMKDSQRLMGNFQRINSRLGSRGGFSSLPMPMQQPMMPKPFSGQFRPRTKTVKYPLGVPMVFDRNRF
jgi:hypothetical protein